MNGRLHARPLNPVIILSPPRYIQPPAFEAALKYLYNDVILTPAECARYCPPDESSASYGYKSYRLEFCFSYWLSGYILGLKNVMAAGLELLRDFMDWETAELFIKASLDVMQTPSFQSYSSPINGPTYSLSSSADPASPLSSRQMTTASRANGDLGIDPFDLEFVKDFAFAMAHGKLEVDLKNFKLDTTPSLILQSYLPDVQQRTKPIQSALASITFGSLPTTPASNSTPSSRSSQPVLFTSYADVDEQIFSGSEKALSAILLNVSFEVLHELFDALMYYIGNYRDHQVYRLDEDDVMRIFTMAVEERESRRKSVADSDWYKSEVKLNRRRPEVDLAEDVFPRHENGEAHLIHRTQDGKIVLKGQSWERDLSKDE